MGVSRSPNMDRFSGSDEELLVGNEEDPYIALQEMVEEGFLDAMTADEWSKLEPDELRQVLDDHEKDQLRKDGVV